MSSTFRSVLVACVLAASTARAQDQVAHVPDPDALVAQLRARAAELPFVRPGELAFGRHDSRSAFPASDGARRAAFDAALRLQSWPDGLLPLLEDQDPRVRLLAAYALFRTVDPVHLPALGRRAEDPGEVTVLPPYAFAIGADGRPIPELRLADLPSETVGGVVRALLQAWGAPSPDLEADFDAFCAQQRALAPTVTALRLRLRLATGGAEPPSTCSPRELLDVYLATRTAPPGAREAAQLGLFGDHFVALAPVMPDVEARLCFAARRLGPANLLRLLRGETPVVDGAPLEPERHEGFGDPLLRFVLDRPWRCGFTDDDVDALLEIGRGGTRVACFRAAARLRPAAAPALLREAIGRAAEPLLSGEETACAVLLHELDADGSADWLVDWFHAAPSPVAAMWPRARGPFAEWLIAANRPVDRRLFARIVADPRFDRVDPQTLLTLVRSLDDAGAGTLADELEMRGFDHPLGLQRAWGDLDRARQQWPEPTARMLDRMAIWRRRIRAAVSDWP